MSTDTDASVSSQSENTPLRSKKWKPWRSLAAYWILGLCNNYGYVVMLSAAHDILQKLSGHSNVETMGNVTESAMAQRTCNSMSTGTILLADIVPALGIKLLAPFLPFYIHIRVAVCVLLAIASLLMVAFATTEGLAIAGVVLTSISSGLGEVSFLQYSAYYSKNVVSTWSSGTGGAGILGSISYASLSQLGLQNTLLIMLVVPVAMAVAFWLILPKPDPSNSQCMLEMNIQDKELRKVSVVKGFQTKVRILPALLKYMIPLGLVYFFEYFINQGLFELVEFDKIFLSHVQQYRWLQVDYQIGVFISRSSVNILHVRKIWLMSVFQLLNVVIFTSETLFYFIPSIWIVFALTLWEGLLGGAAYVNTFYRMSQEMPEDRKQFSMSVTSLADTIGITLAGILAIPVHNSICKVSKPTRLTF